MLGKGIDIGSSAQKNYVLESRELVLASSQPRTYTGQFE